MQLRNKRRVSRIGIAGIASTCVASVALGQAFIEGPPPKLDKASIDGATTLDYPTGEYRGVDISTGRTTNLTAAPAVVWDDVLRVDGVAWLRLYFSADTHLEADSFIRVTSLHDGEVQELDATTLSMWSNTSAYFNGNALRIELVADGFTVDNHFTVEEYAYELGTADRGDGCGICGNDDRAPSTDNNFCRLMPVGCSATTINMDSCMVTAGHCLGYSGAVVHFNVPASNSDCSTNNPPVADQFPVLAESGVNGGVGNDYGAMSIGTNSNGERPYDRYNTYVPLASSAPSSGNLSNHGYGVDSQCDRSQTQQTHSGPLNGTDSSTLYYDIDVTYGNSGSSLVYNGEVVGVVTHCSYNCENYGTRIDSSGFQQAVEYICNGGDPGDCPAGEIEDCNGNCCPANWVGDGYCDDGAYSHNGIPIYLNCEEFDCDGGDCVCDDPGDPVGACCYGTDCADDVTQADCTGNGGAYQGDGSSCASDPCGGGGGGDGDSCNNAIDANTGANAFDTSDNTDSGFGDPDESQCEGTYLDWANSPDEWFRWTATASGSATFSTCDAGSYDTSLVLYSGSSCSSLTQIACNGDAEGGSGCQSYYSEISGVSVTSGSVYYVRIGGWQAATGPGTLTISVEGGGDPTGGCCVGTNCSVQTAADCASMGGDYLGDGSSCAGNPCGGGGGGESTLDLTGIESWDSYESPNNVITTITIPAGSNILALQWDDVTLSAYDPSWASEAGIMFTWENDGVPFSGYLVIFDEDSAPGDYGPVSDYRDLTEDWNFSDADGEIQVEFFETYDDAAGAVDALWTGGTLTVIHDGDGGGDPTGACCVDEDCTAGQTEAYCTAAGGTYLGDGSTCEGDPCASNAVGACCVDLVCTPGQSEAYCTAAGGTYLGDGSTCEGNPCAPNKVEGACCTNNGQSCHVTTAEACSQAGGAYLGDYTTCEGSDPCGVGGDDEFGIAHAVIGTDLIDGSGNYTADVYVTMPMDWRLDAVAGTPEQQKMLTCSGDFYQDAVGGPTSIDINPALYEFYPGLEWDSRVTLGCIDSTGNPFPENNVQHIGIDWTEFESGGDLSVGNGLWFILPTDPAGDPVMFTASDCSQQYGVMIGRLTMSAGSEVGFTGLVQGSNAAGDSVQEVLETYFGQDNFADCNGNMVNDACDIANGTSEDANGNGIPDECDDTCPGDADGDGDSDVDDILAVIASFGQGDGGDVDGDGDTDVDDILQVISWFGAC